MAEDNSSDPPRSGDAGWRDYLKSLGSDVDVEAAQVKHMYPRYFQDLPVKEGFLRIYKFVFEPSDPDVSLLPFPVVELEMTVSLPAGYPEAPCLVEIREPHDTIPPAFCKALGQVLSKQAVVARGSLMVRRLIRWTNNHISEVLKLLIDLQAKAQSAKSGTKGGDEGSGSKVAASATSPTPTPTPTPSSTPSPSHASARPGGGGASGGGSNEVSSHSSVVSARDQVGPVLAAAQNIGSQARRAAGAVGQTRPTPPATPLEAAMQQPWSLHQQQQFETALYTEGVLLEGVEGEAIMGLDPLETWERVAAAVDGKDAQSCVARFLAIRLLALRDAESHILRRHKRAMASQGQESEAGPAVVSEDSLDREGDVAEDDSADGDEQDQRGPSLTTGDSAASGLLPGGRGRGRGRGRGLGLASPGALVPSFASGAVPGASTRASARSSRGHDSDRDSDDSDSGFDRTSAEDSDGDSVDSFDAFLDEVQSKGVSGTTTRSSKLDGSSAPGSSETPSASVPLAGTGAGGGASGGAGGGSAGAAEDSSTTHPGYLPGGRRGTQILLKGLDLLGIGVVRLTRLNLQVQCNRCHLLLDVSLPEAAPEGSVEDSTESKSDDMSSPYTYRSWCPKCSILLHVQLWRALAHSASECIGSLDERNCAAVDFLPSEMEASCLGCDAYMPVSRFQPGTPWDKACSCSARGRMRAMRCEFDRAAPISRNGPKRAAKDKPLFTFSSGRPLPDQGACSHYKRSYKWIRTPCCGKVWPCDKCHDAASDHPMEWALRIVCGNCSTEQPYMKGKPCTSCGFDYGVGRSKSRYWEGGKGCRDLKRLSSKDSKKFRDKNKTISRKARAKK